MTVAEAALNPEQSTECRTGARIPEQFRSEGILTLVIFALSFLYLCLFRRYSWVDPDEGIILQGAQRILDGQLLYRDFFSFFTPGSYYFVALIFRIFGNSFITIHTALAAVGAACSPITYLLARRLCSRPMSLLLAALMTAATVPVRFVVVHNWDSTLLACIGLYCSIRFLESASPAWAFAASTFVSMTGMFEQSKGAGLLLGLVSGFALVLWLQPNYRILHTTRNLLSCVVGMIWPVIIVVLYFASHGAFTQMFSSWMWPLQHYSEANRVPYGYSNLTQHAWQHLFGSGPLGMRVLSLFVFSPALWVPILPLFGPVILVLQVRTRAKGTQLGSDGAYLVVMSAAISGLLLSIIMVRQDYEHFVYLLPAFILVLGWLWEGQITRRPMLMPLLQTIVFFLSMSLLLMSAALFFRTRSGQPISTRRGAILTQKKDDVVEYLDSRVRAGEEILIYPYHPTYYYLSHTYSPSRYEYYQAGMHTSKQLQEMLSEVSAHKVKIVVYDPMFADQMRSSWPNTPASAFAKDPVAEYIMSQYRTCATLHASLDMQYLFMVRKDLQCPEPK